jgi:hypothetical protein
MTLETVLRVFSALKATVSFKVEPIWGEKGSESSFFPIFTFYLHAPFPHHRHPLL